MTIISFVQNGKTFASRITPDESLKVVIKPLESETIKTFF